MEKTDWSTRRDRRGVSFSPKFNKVQKLILQDDYSRAMFQNFLNFRIIWSSLLLDDRGETVSCLVGIPIRKALPDFSIRGTYAS